MRKRAAFTLVEMLVSMALILFVMVLLSQAFSTGLQVFRQLKGLGDMEERLRSTSQIMRRDLAANHFENYRKLSDPTFWNDGPPQQGFFRIWQGSPSTQEGVDGDGLTSTRATTHALHFTSKLSGQGQGDFATSSLPTPVATLVNGSQDGRYNLQNATTQYRGRWYEVAYFLRPNGLTTGSSGVPLYTLYRRQRGIIDNANQIPPSSLPYSQFSEIACQLNGTSVNFLRPDDLPFPSRRFAMTGPTGFPIDSGSYPYLGEPGAPAAWQDNPALQGADLLLSDVISFEVKALAPAIANGDFGDVLSLASIASALDGATPMRYLKNTSFNLAGPMVFDTWAGTNDGVFDFTQWNTPSAATSAPLVINITALKITIRIWDAKTQQARQLTFIQDM